VRGLDAQGPLCMGALCTTRPAPTIDGCMGVGAGGLELEFLGLEEVLRQFFRCFGPVLDLRPQRLGFV
jgi:hypothetical protein